MYKRIITVFASMTLIMLAGVAQAAPLKPAKLLFVIHSKHANVEKTTNPGVYSLKLKNVSASYFTDRPIRRAGQIDIEKFVGAWSKGSDSFAKNNPNAALVTGMELKQDGKSKQVFVVLSQPSYNTNTKVLTLAARTMGNNIALTTGQFKDTVLFVDDLSSIDMGAIADTGPQGANF